MRTRALISRLVNSMSDSRLIIGTGLRGKVQRLLRGDISATDIHDLFFSIRDEAGGSSLVTDVANFIAHPLRTQGSVRQDLIDAVAILRVHFTTTASPILTNDIPASVIDALRANLRRVRKTTLKAWTGMNKSQAEPILERILARSVPTSPGRVSKLSAESEEEISLANCILRNVKGGPQFTDAGLFEDFCRALQMQKLLRASEKQEFRSAKAAVTLFALTALHNRKIDLGDGSVANVAIARDIRGNLGAFAFAEIGKDFGLGKTIGSLWIFETSLPIARYCEPDCAPTERAPFVGDFELKPGSKLGRPT
jgi:hypothetical protein